MLVIDRNRGAKRGREARAALELDPNAPIGCLLDVVEGSLGWPVVVREMPEDVAGACWREDDNVVLHVNARHAWVRQRFTLAHEVGHAWCGHDGKLEVDSVKTISGGTTTPYEVQANAFAAELLLPKAAVEALGLEEPTLEEVVRIAAVYGVSAIVVLIRFRQAKRVSDERYELLKGEIDEQLHLPLYEAADIPMVDERLREIDELPYLSPALRGSALQAALAGEVSVDAAADASACDADVLQDAVARY
jgi:Zn-dependent peptidase ImmA (M78 family)